jgi:hypothetical protein
MALGLFAFIFFYERHAHKPPSGPERILPRLKLSEVTSIQVRPASSGQIELKIVAEKTNNTWRLTEPRPYAAQAASVEDLLAALEQLTAVIHIPESELRKDPKADEDYGFASPQASLIIFQGSDRTIVHIGATTSPGDQVYLEVVGSEGAGAYVVDADLLKHIPRSINDWRETTLVSLDRFAFDRIAVTNNVVSFVTILQRDTNTHLWRMTWPLRVRADSSEIEDSLRQLQNLRVQQFLSDDPKIDLDTLGLAPPELELTLGEGASNALSLQFGKALTNDATQVYARRSGQNTIFSVAKDLIAPWRTPAKDNFRDPFLLRLGGPVDVIEIRDQGKVSFIRQTNSAWRVFPDDIAADSALVRDLLSTLGGLQIIEFVKDAVNPPDLVEYGLASPFRTYVLQAGVSNSAGLLSNSVVAQVDFGFSTNQQSKLFARRTDENSVYALNTNDFGLLPSAGWQLRERQLWRISTNDIARVTIQQKGKVRQLRRNGMYEWALAPGSQGVLANVLAIEDTVRGLAQASAVAWVAHGEGSCGGFGVQENAYKITLELKTGETATIEFGNPAPSNNTYALVSFAGQPWVLEFPWLLYRDVRTYLAVPESP